MINFTSLDTKESFKEVKLVKAIRIDKPSTKINFSKDILKKKPKLSKEELRNTEPGNKIGTEQFHSIAQYCDNCECATSHAHKIEKRKMNCLICKTIKSY